MTENFRRISLESAPRTELHDALGLTGCEVSVNALPAGAAVPFVHRHVKNEEVYGVLEGRGELYIDGEVVELKAGDWFRIPPEGRRAIRAAADQGIRFVCIQTKAGSLEGFTNDDGVACDERRPGSEPAQIHLRGRPCTHPFLAARADGLLRLRSFVRAGSIGNFPSTPFLTLALSSRVSYSVDTRAPGPDGASPKQESKKENP